MLAPNSMQLERLWALASAFEKRARLAPSSSLLLLRSMYSVPKLPAQKASCSVL